MVQFLLMQGHGMTNGNINVHGHLLYVNIEQLIQHLLAPIKKQPVALPLSLWLLVHQKSGQPVREECTADQSPESCNDS